MAFLRRGDSDVIFELRADKLTTYGAAKLASIWSLMHCFTNSTLVSAMRITQQTSGHNNVPKELRK
jgi:hypothetical protein